MNRKNKVMLILCLALTVLLLFSDVIFASHHHCIDDHCVLCLLSSRDKLDFSLAVCGFVMFAVVVLVSHISLVSKNTETLVAVKVKLTN